MSTLVKGLNVIRCHVGPVLSACYDSVPRQERVHLDFKYISKRNMAFHLLSHQAGDISG